MIPHYRCVAGDEVHGKHSLDTPSPASQLHFPTLIFPFLGFCHPSFGWNPACSPATLPLTPPACCKPPLTSTLLHWCEGILTLHLQLLNPLVTPPLPSHPAAPGFPADSSRHWRWVEAWAAAHRAMGTGWSQRGMKRSIKTETPFEGEKHTLCEYVDKHSFGAGYWKRQLKILLLFCQSE